MRKRQSAPAHNSVDISEQSGVRFLHFGSDWVQGAMRIARPSALELVYTREMMAGLLLRDGESWPKTALQIGLGAGSITKFIYQNLPKCRMTVVEINPQVEFIARQYFKLPDDPLRLDVRIEDGADYMLRDGKHFDYILIDGFDADANCGPLDTLPFYQACRARLSDDGLLAVNLLGKNKGFRASTDRIAAAFDGRICVLPASESGNVIAFACAGKPVDTTLDAMREKANQLMENCGLNLLPTIGRLQLSQALPEGKLRI
jgi:spermidine synthase